MKWKGFTSDEVLALRANPYTLTVTEKTISFTREFKERMWEGMQSGQPKRALVIELGYDPDILGPSRIEGIAYHIKKRSQFARRIPRREANIKGCEKSYRGRACFKCSVPYASSAPG